MVASHQRYSVPDSGLRDEMRQKVKEMIQPHYSGSFSHNDYSLARLIPDR